MHTPGLDPITEHALALVSSAFEDGGRMPPQYTCEGENESPPLSFSNLPAGTRTLALIMHDPDVPEEVKPDRNFDHWVLFNIPPAAGEIAGGGSVGTKGANGRGQAAYTGPCPPRQYEPREHRYVFTLYALDAELPLSEGASRTDVETAMAGHVLARATLTGRYEKAG